MSTDIAISDQRSKQLTVDEAVARIRSGYSSLAVLDSVKNEFDKQKANKAYELNQGTLTQALSLDEFKTGVLMASSLSHAKQPFSLQLSLDLQKQYKCDTVSKKALAELTALNYCRCLSLQGSIAGYLNGDSFTDMGVKYLGVLSKELDRAQRHFFTAIQSLELGIQPALNMTVRAQTANIANNQAIQQVEEQTNVKG